VCIRQLLAKSNKPNSWFIYAKSILDLYQVTSVHSRISDIPSTSLALTQAFLIDILSVSAEIHILCVSPEDNGRFKYCKLNLDEAPSLIIADRTKPLYTEM
jgi:hypothetical protein